MDFSLRSRAADTAGFDLDRGLDVIKGRRQDADGLGAGAAGLLGDAIERTVDDAFGSGLLAALHDHVHELGQHVVVVLRVRQNDSDRGLGSA
jgi:hypothetical protein